MEVNSQGQDIAEKVGIDSPTAREIIDSLNLKKPMNTHSFLEKFKQAFIQRQRDQAEKLNNEELKRIEDSIGTSSSGTTRASTSKFQQEHSRHRHFDLNEEITLTDDEYEVHNDRNMPDMQGEDSTFHVAGGSTSNHNTSEAHHNQETEQVPTFDVDLDEAMNPEPPSAEEKEMDKMFSDDKYATLDEISNAATPQLGMEFASREEAFFFFAVYARRMGFAIRKDTSYESRISNVINKQSFTCNRSRSQTRNDSALKQRRTNKIVQTMCKVKLTVKEERGVWTIIKVNLEHNHQLAPSGWITRFMKCHRQMSESDRTLIKMLQETRVPPRNIMKIFRKTRGSFRGIPFDTKFLYNESAKQKQMLKNKDVDELLKCFKEECHKRPGFAHKMQVEDGVVRSVFWTDQIGKANYKQFGQFVSFDTTFSTNQYGLPFAPIVGVDNYGKTVLFGAALLKDETEDSFKWLYEEFVSVMGNNHPETIITDQCVAMGNAIKKVLPFSVHRYYNFHVGKKMKENLVSFFAVRGQLHELLRKVIMNSFTPEEFESGWLALLNEYNAEGEDHLDRIFEIRSQWVPAYFMTKFFPFTSSTGRSESTNSLFKHYVKRKDSISAFFKEYLIIQEKKQSDLDRLRDKTELKETSNWGYHPMEIEAAKIYTDTIYEKFAEEMKKTSAYNIEVIHQGTQYHVTRVSNYWRAEFPRQTYMVRISDDGSEYICSCLKMARDGIHCCHVLRVAIHNGLTELPVSFINTRWTTAAGIELANMVEPSDSTVGPNDNTSAEKTHLAVRHAIEMSKVSHVLSTVCTDDRSYDLFGAGVVQLKKTILDDRMQRLYEQHAKQRNRRAVDDPIPHQAHVANDGGATSNTRANQTKRKGKVVDDRLPKKGHGVQDGDASSYRNADLDLGERSGTDDPLQQQSDVAQDGVASSNNRGQQAHDPHDGGDNMETQVDKTKQPTFDHDSTNNGLTMDANQTSYRDPPLSKSHGFNLGDRPKSHYEKAALKKLKKERKCGLCRQVGHKRDKCPDRDKVGDNRPKPTAAAGDN